MPTTPAIFRVGGLDFGSTVQSGILRTEQLEELPFPTGTEWSAWPPPGYTATGTTVTDSASSSTASLVPSNYNLEWVQGDTASFQFVFTDVLWTPTDPEITTEGAPTWQETNWAAQVRNPYIYSTYAADYWVPAYGYQYNWWRGHSTVATFDVTAEAYEFTEDDVTSWSTLVTLTLPASNSALIIPGNWYHWDMQIRTADDVVRTYLRGKVRVVTEWTVA